MTAAHATHAAPGENDGNGVTDLLWTGGWDSTFRLLMLALVHRRTIQPFYLVDPYRPSTLHEIRAMARIREELHRYPPEQVGTILPTRIYSTAELERKAEVRTAFESLRRKWRIGGQYEWLALFAARQKVAELELSIHSDDRFGFIRRFAEKRETANVGEYWTISAGVPGEIEPYRRLTFPLLDWTKADMQAAAKDNRFEDILEHTWFCHKPIKGKPCGLCAPCGYALGEGMGHRLPWPAKLRRALAPAYRAPRRVKGWILRSMPVPGVVEYASSVAMSI